MSLYLPRNVFAYKDWYHKERDPNNCLSVCCCYWKSKSMRKKRGGEKFGRNVLMNSWENFLLSSFNYLFLLWHKWAEQNVSQQFIGTFLLNFFPSPLFSYFCRNVVVLRKKNIRRKRVFLKNNWKKIMYFFGF